MFPARMGKFWISVLAAMAALAAPESTAARTWSAAELADLELAAETAPREGLPVPAALSRVAERGHLHNLGLVDAAELDAAADALFREMAYAYARGAIDPGAVGADWHIPRPEPNIADLEQALDGGWRPSMVLAGLLPASPEYRALRGALAALEADENASGRAAHLAQLRANMERWRWLPRETPPERLEVRIAQYEVIFHRGGGAPAMTHNVIVGARSTPTPVFAATLQSVTVNPYWTPPSSILLNELLPRFRRNPNAAAREGYEAIDGNGQVVAPGAVNWSARPFPYQLRQTPGAHNALGQIRFNLPNPFAVYLHDTPSKRLFERANRALSHGCIRVQSPTELAAAVLNDRNWSREALEAAMSQGASQTIPLGAPIPVYVLYFTTALDQSGQVVYLDDIYRRDRAVVAALDRYAARSVASLERSELCSP